MHTCFVIIIKCKFAFLVLHNHAYLLYMYFSTCEYVVKNNTNINCALCQCKYENRNTTTIKVGNSPELCVCGAFTNRIIVQFAYFHEKCTV